MIKQTTALCALFGACATFGAGFQVLEQGASNLGTALAGSTANANADATSAFWNPSSAFEIGLAAGKTTIDSGMNFVIPSFSFTGSSYYTDASGNPLAPISGSNGGNAGEMAYVPNFNLVHMLADDLAITFSITSPYGLETDYDSDWVGRYQALNSDLTTVDINPSLAYKVNDWLSVSGGVSLQYMHAELTQASPTALGDAEVSLRGQSWGVGGNIGFTIKYAEGGRLGFHWRSEVSQDITGNQHMTLPALGYYDRILAPIETNLSRRLSTSASTSVSGARWTDSRLWRTTPSPAGMRSTSLIFKIPTLARRSAANPSTRTGRTSREFRSVSTTIPNSTKT